VLGGRLDPDLSSDQTDLDISKDAESVNADPSFSNRTAKRCVSNATYDRLSLAKRMRDSSSSSVYVLPSQPSIIHSQQPFPLRLEGILTAQSDIYIIKLVETRRKE
jgi:hypothetical protein